MCGVEGKRRLCDLNVTSSSPALTTRHIRCVLLVKSPNKLNLLSWLLIYLCNKLSMCMCIVKWKELPESCEIAQFRIR